MSDFEKEKRKNWLNFIERAISSWEDKKRGVYMWWEKERHTPDYCQEQIEYFQKLR